MANVDERIVSMKFDNAQFEKGVSTSISSIDKLKAALNFDKQKSAFDDINKGVKSVDFSALQQGLDNLNKGVKSVDFSALQQGLDDLNKQFSVVGIASQKIVQDVVGKIEQEYSKLYSFVVKEPLTDGFKEYELKMGSVQTIVAGTGASLEEVNNYLEELNLYADKTIYSFSDMTNSIGKFTNAGVNLGDAVAAIQGVSNVAAVSGANANEASRAMYNFAQALSAGYVKLIDWKSIENANMATVEFKNELIKTAEELGTVVKVGDNYLSQESSIAGKTDKAFNATLNFNDSLQEQWMTTDVLVTTLKRYTDETTELGRKAFAAAQDVKTWTQLIDTLKEALGSGWGKSFELVIGDFEEAKELFTIISNMLGGIIDKVSDFRNNLLQAWHDNGGRDSFINQLKEMESRIDSITDKVLNFADNTLKSVMGWRYEQIFGNGARAASELGESINEVANDKTIKRWRVALDIWGKELYGTGEERRSIINEMFGDEDSYGAIQGMIDEIISGTQDYGERLKWVSEQEEKLNEATQKNTENQNELKESLTETDEIAERWHRVLEDVIGTSKLLFTTVKNIASGIINIGTAIVKSFFRTFKLDALSTDVRDFARDLAGFSNQFKEATSDTDSLSHKFDGLFEIINKVYSIIRVVFAVGKTLAYDAYVIIHNIFVTIVKIFDALNNNGVLGRLFNIITGLLQRVIDIVVGVGQAFYDVFGGDAEKLIGKVASVLGTLYENGKEFVKLGFDAFLTLLEHLAGVDSFNGGIESFGQIVKNMFISILEGGRDLYSFVKDKLSQIFTKENLSSGLSWIKTQLQDFFNGLNQIDFKTLLTIVAIIWKTFKIVRAFDAIKNTFSGVSDVIANIGDSISSVRDAILTKLKSGNIVAWVVLILGLVGALITLAQLPQDQVVASALAIGFVISTVSTLLKVIDKMNKSSGGTQNVNVGITGSKQFGLGVMFVGIAAMIGALAWVLSLFNNEENNLIDGMMSLGIIIAGVVVILGLISVVLKKAEKVDAAADVLNKIGKSMMKIGVFLVITAGIVYLFQKLGPIQKTAPILLALVVFVGLLMLVIAGVAKINAKVKNITAITKAMKAMSGVFLSLVPLIAIFAILSKMMSLGELATLVLIIGEFGVIVAGLAALFVLIGALANHMNVQPKTIISIAGAIIILAAALAILMVSGALTALINALSNGAFIKGLLIVTGSMVGIALAIVILAIALNKFVDIGVKASKMAKNFAVSFLAIAAAVLAIVVAFILLPKAADGLVAFAQALEEHGPEMAKAALVIVMVILGAILTGVAISKGKIALAVVELIVVIFQTLAAFLDGSLVDVVEEVVHFFIKGAALLGMYMQVIADTVFKTIEILLANIALAIHNNRHNLALTLYYSFYEVILAFVEMLAYSVAGALDSLFGPLLKKLGWLDKWGIKDFKETVDLYFEDLSVGTDADEVANNITKLIDDATEGINNSLEKTKTATESGNNIIKNGLGALTTAVTGGTADLGLAFDTGGKTLKESSDTWNESIKNGIRSFASELDFQIARVHEGGVAYRTAMEEEYNKNRKQNWMNSFLMANPTKTSDEAQAAYTEYMYNMRNWGVAFHEEEGEKNANSYIDGFKNEISEKFNLDDILGENLTAGDNIFSMLGGVEGMDFTNLDFGSMISSGFIDSSGNVMDGVDFTVDDMLNQFGSYDGDFMGVGENYDSEVANGLEYNTEEVEAAGNQLAEALMNTIEGVGTERAKKIGIDISHNYMEGLKQGITDNTKMVLWKVTELGNHMKLRLEKALSIASPSKETYRIGSFFTQGITLGMISKEAETLSATESLANSMVSALTTPINTIQGLLNGELEFDPTIRPVMDISSVQRGVDAINTLNYRNMEMGVRAATGSIEASIADNDISSKFPKTYNDTNVLTSIDKLNENVNTLNESLGGMRIVMDTGAVVGQISGAMDEALGVRQRMRGRGI